MNRSVSASRTDASALYLGAHVSVAGGLPSAFERADRLDCTAIQIFVKNNNRWQGRSLEEDEVERFRAAHAASRVGPVVAHSSYLINLAAQNEVTFERSRVALVDELERCERLGVAGLVLHPGSHVGAGEETGLERISQSLATVFEATAGYSARVLLELTAGQGTNLGYTLEQLAWLVDRAPADRIGVCIDTCHAFAAGYPVHTVAGYEEFVTHLEKTFGLEQIRCIHLNDSLKPFASKRDRHANLGEGLIGVDSLVRWVRDPRWRETPILLETPTGDDSEGHRRDLALLR